MFESKRTFGNCSAGAPFSALAFAMAMMLGCGGSGGSTLTGKVTYNGQPLDSGFISFAPAGGGASFGAAVVDGAYSAEKAAPGKYVATISATRSPSLPPLTRDELAKNPNYSPNYIPEDAAGNKQTVDVVAGGQLDFAVTGPPRP